MLLTATDVEFTRDKNFLQLELTDGLISDVSM